MAALTTAMKHLTLAPNQEFLDLLASKYSGKEFTVEELQADEELTGFLTTKKTKKAKLSSHERASLAYNPHTCCARVWLPIKGKKGMAVQCTGITGDAKKEGGLCNRCAKPGKCLWLGRMDEDMPPLYPEPVFRKPEFEGDDMGPKGKDAHYLMQDAEGKPIEMPVEEPKKKKASTSTGEPNKRGRKPGSKNKKKKSSVEEDQAAEIAKLKAMLSAKAEKPDDEVVDDLTQSEEEAAGVGLDQEGSKKEEEDAIEEDVEEDEYESLVFEGVEYQKNKVDDTVLDPEDFSVVGVWKDGGIEWEDDEARENHESNENHESKK
jgi:hypothetical protein